MVFTQASTYLPLSYPFPNPLFANADQPPIPESTSDTSTPDSNQNEAPHEEKYQRRRWALVWWQDNTIACNIFVEGEEQPQFPLIEAQCGERLLKAWKNTPPCLPLSSTETHTCKGLYLFDMGWVDAAQSENPISEVSIVTSAVPLTCTEENVCLEQIQNEPPSSTRAVSADPNETAVEIDQEAMSCQAQSCEENVAVADQQGVDLKNQPENEENDRGIDASIEALTVKDNATLSSSQDEKSKKKDSTEGELDACAEIWDITPDEDTLEQGWIARGDDPDLLQTSEGLALLAGQLIRAGFVDASDCPNNGLLENGYADTCGNEQARDLVLEWQNRSNSAILHAALEAGIPPWLLKGLILQETQFWPTWEIEHEFGYGMLTEKGVDMLLNWNIDFFLEICNDHYTPDDCAQGYSSLSDNQQRFLRGASLLSIGSDDEFRLLASMLWAACAQSNRLVKNVTHKEASDLFDYEEMWRLSLGVYNAGAGCMSNALDAAWSDKKSKIDWSALQGQLTPACKTAGNYFDQVISFSPTPSSP